MDGKLSRLWHDGIPAVWIPAIPAGMTT